MADKIAKISREQNTEDQKTVTIGERLRMARTENALSIQQLAKLSGVSTAAIYKIERNEMTPTVTLLMKVAKVLNKKLGFFVEEEGNDNEVRLIRKTSRVKVRDVTSSVFAEKLSGALHDQQLEAGLLTVSPRTGITREEIVHKGEEFVFCMSGEAVFVVDGQEYILGAGDAIHFKSHHRHFWKNKGRRRAKLLFVLTPPTFT